MKNPRTNGTPKRNKAAQPEGGGANLRQSLEIVLELSRTTSMAVRALLKRLDEGQHLPRA